MQFGCRQIVNSHLLICQPFIGSIVHRGEQSINVLVDHTERNCNCDCKWNDKLERMRVQYEEDIQVCLGQVGAVQFIKFNICASGKWN